MKQRERQPTLNYECLPTIPARRRDARPWPLAIYGRSPRFLKRRRRRKAGIRRRWPKR